jgi:hypothetical protein
MNPKRTFEAIDEVLDGELTTGGLISEQDVDDKLSSLAGDGLTYDTDNENLDVDTVTIFNNPTFTNTVTIAGDTPKLTGVPNPTDNNDAANKSYVDALAQGIKARTQALVYVDFDLDATYDNQPTLHELTADNNVAFPEVDDILSSVLNVEGARILVAGQTNKEENGLYVVKTAGVDGVSP